MKKRVVESRKLLVASIGVASMLYACDKREAYPPGNLVAPPPSMVTSGNLVAPPVTLDAGDAPPDVRPAGDAAAPATDAQVKPLVNVKPPPLPTSGIAHPPGNLMPPPPPPKPPMPKAR